MKKAMFILIPGLFFVIGCATVKVQAPKEAIKVDISMRLDVYQHVQKDIDAIESIVTGSGAENKIQDKQSLLGFVIGTAYAQDISPELEQAALRRKARYSQLISLERQGVIGENRSGLVTLKQSGDASAESIVSGENADRMIIYNEIAAKNGTSVGDVQKIYADRLQQDAPAGTPIETAGGSWGTK